MCSKKAPDSCISHANDLDSLSYPMLTFSMNSFWLFVFRQKISIVRMPKYLYYVAMCNVTFHCPQRPLEVSLNSKERLSLLKTAQKELHHDDDGALAQIPCVLRPDAATKKSAWTWPALAVVVLGRQAGSSHPKISYGRSSIQIFRT